MEIKNNTIRDVYVPNRLIFRHEVYQIIDIVRKFTIREYIIKTVDNKIDMVILNNPHPNANPQTGEFCIPNYLRSYEINKQSLQFIENMLRCFNLDSCYFTPWSEIEYRRLEVGLCKKINPQRIII